MIDYNLQPGKKINKVEYSGNDVLISIITPVFYGHFLEQTARCVLNQTFPYFEWIIVNDGTKDKIALENIEKVRKLDKRIKVFEKENEGLSKTRDYGARKASKESKYFVFLDDDDLIDSNYLEMLFYTLEINKDASWAYTDTLQFGGRKIEWKKHFDSEQMKKENLLVATGLIRKEAFFEVNGYTVKEKKAFEDWNFWLKLIAKGHFPVHVSTNSFWYRIKDDGELVKATSNKAKANEIIRNTAKTITTSVDAIEYPRETYNWEKIERNKVLVPKLKSKKINLLFIFPWMVLGGADKFNLDLIGSLNREKYSITIITTQQTEYRWKQKFEQVSDTVFELPAFLDRKDWPAFMEYIIDSRNINIIFNSNSSAGYAMLPYLKCLYPNITVLDYIHMEEWYNRNGGYSRDSYGVSSVIDKTYFCNKNSENILRDFFGVNKDKIDTVYIGVDTKVFDPKKYNKKELMEKYNIPKDKKIISFVARIDYQKRPFLLLKIVQKLIEKNKNVHFVVAGDGPLLNKIKKKTIEYKLSDYITYLGKIDNPSEIYMISDLSLNCSIKEGLALTSYESLSLGIPVVSSDVGGQKELITKDVGVIVPCFQKEEDAFVLEYTEEEINNYVDAIEKVLNDNEKYKKECRNHVIKDFNIESMYKKFDSEFDHFSKTKPKSTIPSNNLDIARELYVHYLLESKELNRYLNRQYNKTVYGDENVGKKKEGHSDLPVIGSIKKFLFKHNLGDEYNIFRDFAYNFVHLLKNLFKCTFGFVFKIIVQLLKRIVGLFKKIF